MLKTWTGFVFYPTFTRFTARHTALRRPGVLDCKLRPHPGYFYPQHLPALTSWLYVKTWTGFIPNRNIYPPFTLVFIRKWTGKTPNQQRLPADTAQPPYGGPASLIVSESLTLAIT